MDSGILYIASGEGYLDEVKRSVKSIRNHMTECPITLISDSEIDIQGVDKVIVKDGFNYDYSDSIPHFDDIPYQRTLQLDTDTYVCNDISDMFCTLNHYDLGATINPAPRYYNPEDPTYSPTNIPKSFPLFNTGVLLYKKNNRTARFFEKWRNIYFNTLDSNPKGFNQPAFRDALYNSDVQAFPLPAEYNSFILLPGYVTGEVKIVHGRHPDIAEVANILNKSTEPRCYNKHDYPIKIIEGTLPGEESSWYKFKRRMRTQKFSLPKEVIRSIRENGLVYTVKKGVEMIR